MDAMRGWIATGVLVACMTAACGSGSVRGGHTTPRTATRSFDPTGVAFSSRDDGVVVGGRTIATTSDGGRSWTVRRHGAQPLAAVTIVPGGTVIASIGRCTETCARPGGLLASTDGGRTWSVRSRAPLYQPSFATPDFGWALLAAGPNAIRLASTRDGGRRWNRLPDPCPSTAPIAESIAALDRRSAELLCVSGNAATDMEGKALLRTRDAGRAWRTIAAVAPVGAPPAGVGPHGLPNVGVMPGMTVRPDGHGWLWADRGWMVATRGGRRWHVVSREFQPDVDFVRSLDFLDGRTGFALAWRSGATRLLRSRDGGRRWTVVHAWSSRS